MTPFLTTPADSSEDLQAANQADPRRLSEEARYRFEERLGILAGSGTPTASQVALAWREALAVDSPAAASQLKRRTAS